MAHVLRLRFVRVLTAEYTEDRLFLARCETL